MCYKLASYLEKYITKEIKDSMYCDELLKIAPTGLSRQMLRELSSDEKKHAESLKHAYRHLAGIDYIQPEITVECILSYEDGLKTLMLSETEDYKNYGALYLEASDKYLKDLFFMIKIGEALHAMKIPLLFEEIR